MAELKDILKQLLKDNEEIYSIVGTVEEVNEDKRVCKIKPIDDSAELFNVRLQTKVSSSIGLVLFPKQGSQVTVTFMSKELAFVSQTDEIEKILLNIEGFSLFIDKENFETEVKNKKNTVDNYDTIAKNAIFEIETLFKVISQAQIVLEAQALIMQAQTVGITGVTTIDGQTTVNGATTINAATIINALLTVNGAAVISGAMSAASATIAGGMSVGGGSNGGVPTGGALKTQLDEIKDDLNELKSKLSSWTPVNHDGGAALKALISSYASATLPPTDLSSISNPNFVH